MAMALKQRNSKAKVYVLVGDGEFNEGTMWEGCILACSEKLDNLCLIVDDNKSINKMVRLENFIEILLNFGFSVNRADGHNCYELDRALTTPVKNQPLCVIAQTKRGYGCNTIMNDNSWFHRAPTAIELDDLIKDVDNFEK